MLRVWFNHWFSTSYRLMELMRQDKEEKIVIIGSNGVGNSVLQNVCDEWYIEPEMEREEYISFCLDFCKEHQIDVFVPRRNMVEISREKGKFQEIGVKVLVDDYDKIAFLNDKAKTYDLFASCQGIHVPDYCVVNTAEEFQRAYESLSEKYEDICYKFVQDEGGMSFRKIVEEEKDFHSLRIYAGSRIYYKELITILKTQERFADIMVMPYLPGNEISVDCLNTEQGLIAVIRDKGFTRDERVCRDEAIENMCKIVLEKVPLECPCNVQFKIKDEIPYLLEVNTRMSGGLQMGCLASGVNIPNIALNKLLGRSVEWKQNRDEKIVSYIEIPQIVGEKQK